MASVIWPIAGAIWALNYALATKRWVLPGVAIVAGVVGAIAGALA